MYSRILVPVDGSATSLEGLEEAIKVAGLTGGKLKLVHVVDELVLDTGYGPAATGEIVDAMREGGRQVLNDAVSLARKRGADVESELIETLAQSAADAILAAAGAWHAELIVMGTHGRRGLSRLAMGSDAEKVVRSTPVPVLMIRAIDESVEAVA